MSRLPSVFESLSDDLSVGLGGGLSGSDTRLVNERESDLSGVDIFLQYYGLVVTQ